jgi:hypothetical protein
MNEVERNKIMEAEEMVQMVQAAYSGGFGIEAGTGENPQAQGFVGAKDLLGGILRPRLVSRGKDPNWEETYIRLVEVYDILLSNVSLHLGEEAFEGTVNAVMDPKSYFLDLTEVFYELFPQARDVNIPSIPRRSLRLNILLVMDDNLTRFLSPDSLRASSRELGWASAPRSLLPRKRRRGLPGPTRGTPTSSASGKPSAWPLVLLARTLARSRPGIFCTRSWSRISPTLRTSVLFPSLRCNGRVNLKP